MSGNSPSAGTTPTPAGSTTPADAAAASETASPAEQADAATEVLTEKTLAAAMQEAVEQHRSAHYSMTVMGAQSGTADMELDGVIDYRGPSPVLSLTMSGPAIGGATGEVRVLRDTMYLSMPPMTPDGKFIEVDLREGDDPMASMLAPGDPMSAFGSFDTDLRSVEYVGEESVSGEDLHHYVVAMDGRSVAGAMRMAPDRLPRSIDFDLWLDDEALMRRLTVVFGGEGTLEIEMWDWGRPVTVQAPPEKDITRP